MKWKKWLAAAALVAAVAVSLLTGCTDTETKADPAVDGEKWKLAVADAYGKRGDIRSYAFVGELYIKMSADDGSLAIASPLLSGLIPELTGSESITLQGIVHNEPLQLEADLALHKETNNQSYNIPLIIQDNKLYISIPTLNKENEYFLVDQTLDPNASDPFDPSIALEWLEALDVLVPSIIAETEPQWVKRSDNYGENGSGDSGTVNTAGENSGSDDSGSDLVQGPMTVEVPITEQNAEQIGKAISAGWADMVDALSQHNLIAEDPTKLRNEGETGAFLPEPGTAIRVSIDDNGYIAEQVLEFSSSEENQIRLKLVKSEINSNPEITRSVPEQVISFSDVLKFISAERAKATQP